MWNLKCGLVENHLSRMSSRSHLSSITKKFMTIYLHIHPQNALSSLNAHIEWCLAVVLSKIQAYALNKSKTLLSITFFPLSVKKIIFFSLLSSKKFALITQFSSKRSHRWLKWKFKLLFLRNNFFFLIFQFYETLDWTKRMCEH